LSRYIYKNTLQEGDNYDDDDDDDDDKNNKAVIVLGNIYVREEGDYTTELSENCVKRFASKHVFSQSQEAGYGVNCIDI
jgi:hypothetical protein